MVAHVLLAIVLLGGIPDDGKVRQDTVPPRGTIRGQLRTSGGESVFRAVVQALPSGLQTTSDQHGAFLLTGLDPGLVVLHIRGLGFQAKYVQVALAPNSGWSGTIHLEWVAQMLPEVVVRGQPSIWKPSEYADTHKYDDFFRRMKFGAGTFLDRETIHRRNATTLLELLQGTPGIRVRYNPPGSPAPTTVRMARCEGNPPNLAFYIDGNRIPMSAGVPKTAGSVTFGGGSPESNYKAAQAFEETLNSIHPRDIEMMEIYRGVSELPSDLGRDVCAAIVVWTH